MGGNFIHGNVLVVDDERTFTFPAEYARTSNEAIGLLDLGYYDYIWLDHDLGGEDKGIFVVDWLCKRSFFDSIYPVKEIFVHSMNPGASDDMVRSLVRYSYNARRVPLPTMK